MDKKRIIFLSPVEYFKGGAERSLFDLTANPNIVPIIFAPEQGPILEKAKELGFDHAILPFGSIRNIHRPFSFMKGFTAIKDLWRASIKLKKEAKQRKTEIVHSNGLKAHMINCVSACIGGPKAVLHIRDIPYTRSEKIVWHIMRFLCNAMIVVSNACWPDEKIPPKVHVIHNGTDIPSNIEAATKNFVEINVGFVGRIHPAKGLHLLIDWLAAARKDNLNIKLIVRGSLSEDPPNYEQSIFTQINNLGLSENIDFQGFVSNPSQIYDDIDIVCVPSHIPDPLPRSVMEAMAHGLPVLGYPSGGIPDMIEHGKTGYLVANAQDFITALKSLSEIENRERVLKAARKKIQEKFSIQQLHENVTNLYETLSKG
nr:glycosyltransferase [Cytophagales bacterium]